MRSATRRYHAQSGPRRGCAAVAAQWSITDNRSACAIRMAVRSRSTAEADLDLMLNRIAAAQVVCSGEYRLQRPERRQPQMLSSRSKKDRYR